jgi:hypothetical protein
LASSYEALSIETLLLEDLLLESSFSSCLSFSLQAADESLITKMQCSKV